MVEQNNSQTREQPVSCNTCGRSFSRSPSQIKRRDYMCTRCVRLGRIRRGKPQLTPRTEHRKLTESARQKVAKAIKAGRLVRQPCEVCGNPQTHGHHRDYSKPLEVQWLCGVHHKAAHKEMAARGIQS